MVLMTHNTKCINTLIHNKGLCKFSYTEILRGYEYERGFIARAAQTPETQAIAYPDTHRRDRRAQSRA